MTSNTLPPLRTALEIPPLYGKPIRSIVSPADMPEMYVPASDEIPMMTSSSPPVPAKSMAPLTTAPDCRMRAPPELIVGLTITPPVDTNSVPRDETVKSDALPPTSTPTSPPDTMALTSDP